MAAFRLCYVILGEKEDMWSVNGGSASCCRTLRISVNVQLVCTSLGSLTFSSQVRDKRLWRKADEFSFVEGKYVIRRWWNYSEEIRHITSEERNSVSDCQDLTTKPVAWVNRVFLEYEDKDIRKSWCCCFHVIEKEHLYSKDNNKSTRLRERCTQNRVWILRHWRISNSEKQNFLSLSLFLSQKIIQRLIFSASRLLKHLDFKNNEKWHCRMQFQFMRAVQNILGERCCMALRNVGIQWEMYVARSQQSDTGFL